jgi:UDP-N-acetylmuramate--alanine ligase
MNRSLKSKVEGLKSRKVHLVGICGMGMTALALILKDMGTQVDGSDVGTGYPTMSTLLKYNIPVLSSFSKTHVTDVDAVVYSGANGGSTNEEVVEAKRQEIATESLAYFIGKLSAEKQTISVCGCHGKSTTSALVAYVGEQLGLPMSYYVGAPSFMGQAPGAWKKGDYFVVESDEYVADPITDRTPKFNYLHPSIIISTNIDFDHPDVFKDIEEIELAFEKFFSKVPKEGFLVVNGDDARLLRLARKSEKTFYTYGEGVENDYRISQITEYGAHLSFVVSHGNNKLGEFTTKLLGIHNVYNAVAVIALYTILKHSVSDIQKALYNFTGVSRRLEFYGQTAETILYDDYAHHPAEITASISALKNRFPKCRVTVVFQPHTFSRTEKLQDDLIDSLKTADAAIIVPIFGSARESAENFAITSEKLVQKAHEKNIMNLVSTASDTELSACVRSYREKYPRHIFVTMGAGDVYNKLPVIKKALV